MAHLDRAGTRAHLGTRIRTTVDRRDTPERVITLLSAIETQNRGILGAMETDGGFRPGSGHTIARDPRDKCGRLWALPPAGRIVIADASATSTTMLPGPKQGKSFGARWLMAPSNGSAAPLSTGLSKHSHFGALSEDEERRWGYYEMYLTDDMWGEELERIHRNYEELLVQYTQ